MRKVFIFKFNHYSGQNVTKKFKINAHINQKDSPLKEKIHLYLSLFFNIDLL